MTNRQSTPPDPSWVSKEVVHTSLTKRISSIQFFSILLASVLTFLSGLSVSYVYLDKLFNDKADIVFTSIENELVTLGYALNSIEANWDQELKTVLPMVAESLAESEHQLVAELSPAELKQIAREYGLTDLYLINDQLIVTAASFEEDIGLDMSQFSEEYTAYLRDLMNQGRVGVDPISVSTETGQLKKYAYYSPPDSNRIINADIGVYDRIAAGEPNSVIINSLYTDVIQRFSSNHEDVVDVDVFLISGIDQWSLFNEGRQLPQETASALRQGQVVIYDQVNQVTLFQKMPFARYEAMGYEIYAMIVFDQSDRSEAMFNSLLYSLIGVLLVILFTWFSSFFVLRRFIVSRFDYLMRQIARISDLHGSRIDIEGADEITKIGDKMNEMLGRIEAEAAQRDMFENLSHIDQLTQVANRRRLDEVLNSEVSRVDRGLGDLCIIMLDIDWFKGYNDHYGHLAGDEALRNVASILTQCAQRPTDLVARFGGEEFVCVVPGNNRETGHQLAASIVDEVFNAQIPNQASPLDYLSVSCGCLFVSKGQSCTPRQVIAQLDALLYQSKSEGKHRFNVADFVSSDSV